MESLGIDPSLSCETLKKQVEYSAINKESIHNNNDEINDTDNSSDSDKDVEMTETKSKGKATIVPIKRAPMKARHMHGIKDEEVIY